MENKYYTPTIEEFHIGFEYQVKDYRGDNKWHSFVVDDSFTFRYTNGYLKSEIYRVKYLDREDIESLGFESTKPLWYQYHNDRYMIVNLSNKGKNMYSITDKRDDTYLFYGTIKNKSELKKMLEMIGYEA